MNIVSFNQNEVIFREGSFGNTMYDILGGRVGIYADYGTEKEKKITELGFDNIFGEMGVIAVIPRTATAVALDDNTTLAEISEETLNDYFKDKPGKLLTIMKQLSHRLRETTQNYVDACRTLYENEAAQNNGCSPDELLAERIALYSQFYQDTMML